ncbi:MAG: hypothetical protein QY309_13230 [Cyclobacteriaceae bacterium]|nr:MAG: hypothetical protein QY309_13230 [Cyclobacteriaceae bacterium]
MDVNTAKQILLRSIVNLQKRRGQLTVPDIETEVINNACLAVLQNGDLANSIHYAAAFAQAARELIPEYGESEATFALVGVPQNILWEGMWDHLRDYFQKHHGIQIDNVPTNAIVFYSTSHKRFEKGNLVADTPADRTININLIDDKKEIVVSIEPTLSPKKGYLISSKSNLLQYKGYDPDYLFTLQMDGLQEIEQFTLEMPNRSLKIIYFE